MVASEILERWKPTAAARTHMLAAALMWTVVGGGLFAVGLRWVYGNEVALSLALLATAVGLFKSRLVLDRTAIKAIARIRERGDGQCLGGFQSPLSWAMIGVMMVGGRLLRHFVLTPGQAGLLFIAVGSALLSSSRVHWAAYRRG